MLKLTYIATATAAALLLSATTSAQMRVTSEHDSDAEVYFEIGTADAFKEALNLSNAPKPDIKANDLDRSIITPEGSFSVVEVPTANARIGSRTQTLQIENSYQDQDTFEVVVTARNPKTGQKERIQGGDFFVIDQNGNRKEYRVKSIEEAQAPIAVYVLLDVSGSMSGLERHILSITNTLFDSLPDHALCTAITFGANIRSFGGEGVPCKSEAIGLNNITMVGGTPTFRALEQAYSELSKRPDHQKFVLIITDGVPSDTADEPGLLALKGETTTIFYWLGSKGENAESVFGFSADHYINDQGDPFKAIGSYYEALTESLDQQAVIVISDGR